MSESCFLKRSSLKTWEYQSNSWAICSGQPVSPTRVIPHLPRDWTFRWENTCTLTLAVVCVSSVTILCLQYREVKEHKTKVILKLNSMI